MAKLKNVKTGEVREFTSRHAQRLLSITTGNWVKIDKNEHGKGKDTKPQGEKPDSDGDLPPEQA